MQLPGARGAFPTRRLARTAVVGVLCALAVFGAGRLLAWAMLGENDMATRARVEEDVRGSLDVMSRELQDLARGVADADALLAASQRDTAAARRLFDAAAAALTRGDEGDLAVTAYTADGTPLAWAGRPSELPSDRLAGNEAWFLAPGALGLRLVHVMPVTDQAQRRVGTIAAERAIGTSFPSRIAPVSIDLPFDTGGTTADPSAFAISAPSGQPLVTARVDAAELARVRDRWRRATLSLTLVALALTLAVIVGPLLDWRNVARRGYATRRDGRPHYRYVAAVLLTALAIAGARLVLLLASPADWSTSPLLSSVAYASPLLRPLLTSPFDFLLTALTVGALVALALFGVEATRVALWHRRRPLSTLGSVAGYLLMQVAAGIALALLLLGHQALLRDTIANTTLDLLHFSLHPWDTPRIALQLGLVIWHATTLACAVLILRLAGVWWIVPRHHWRLGAIAVLLWTSPLVIWQVMARVSTAAQLPLLLALAAAIGIARYGTALKGRYRHGSQAFRLTMMTLGLVVPALAFYPTLFHLAWQAKTQLVETRYGPQAVNLRQTVQKLLQQSLEEIDMFPGVADLITVPSTAAEALTDRAFQVWRVTSLASYPVTSSVELYGPEDTLVSRFAFNLPEDLTTAPQSQESTCTWDVYEEVAPFFAEERRVLHAGRALCAPDGRILGSIVVHAMLDWENLPFIASQSPYVELLRPEDPLRGEGISGRDVEFAFYGWSRRPLYSSSGRAWLLEDDAFARIEQSRMPLWAELRRGEEAFDAYVQNDRGGIYVLGFPIVSALGHVVNLAELTLLAWLTYAVLLTATALFGVFSRRGATAPALLREVRASFYRKLLLAFIAATVVPVAALALAVGTYVADEMRGNVEEEAVRTASAARRVVEDLVAPRAAQQGVGVDDNLMVWVSRLIDQDVNIFSGPRLLATSERNLFASGLLPVRTPADVFRDIELRREAATVTPEQIGSLEYLVAASPMTARDVDAILTVPLASQAQEIESQIDTMYRYVLLGALLFVLGGAFIGYWLAERIADPVNRLTRATRRLARGDLDVRVAATSSDELRRLVEDFNRMAADLQHQRKELERTHRLEAWAEMARQVAHDIKNPLTPIQLNAEHLRRVHADRGEPLSPVLQECVATILTQVKLLRQIASEFSSFASAPTARPSSVEVQELLREIVDPYRTGLSDRITFDVDVPSNLPPIYVDRTLITRALTNLVENALHAMPATGTIKVVARSDNGVVRVRVSDTGVGMDQEALSRAFEPYFSTKATGTGLGLPIAKRNVEANGGSINVVSERDRGTTVEITLPAESA